jgi:hypothetical protein
MGDLFDDRLDGNELATLIVLPVPERKVELVWRDDEATGKVFLDKIIVDPGPDPRIGPCSK